MFKSLIISNCMQGDVSAIDKMMKYTWITWSVMTLLHSSAIFVNFSDLEPTVRVYWFSPYRPSQPPVVESTFCLSINNCEIDVSLNLWVICNMLLSPLNVFISKRNNHKTYDNKINILTGFPCQCYWSDIHSWLYPPTVIRCWVGGWHCRSAWTWRSKLSLLSSITNNQYHQ